jgi:acetyl-CoA carboxylase beta subunit
MSIQFTQSCPTCGRRIQVQASLMGHSVACPHCNAHFNATGGSANEVAMDGPVKANHVADTKPVDPLMARVEKALARVSDQPTMTG